MASAGSIQITEDALVRLNIKRPPRLELLCRSCSLGGTQNFQKLGIRLRRRTSFSAGLVWEAAQPE